MTHLSDIKSVIAATMLGDDVAFRGVSTDSRNTQSGQLFFARTGPKFDGHEFVAEAEENGAAAVVVTHQVNVNIPQLIVSDVDQALGKLAAWHRQQFQVPVIAITGSCGKTTTKAMLASIFGQLGKTLSPEGSFNNHVGLPLTLMQLDESYDYVILELGANHPGEIDYLVKIARPDVAAVTLVAPVHLEGFGTIENIAKAKGEIFNTLTSQNIAVINADDPLSKSWENKLKNARVLTFGSATQADVSARQISTTEDGLVKFQLITATESVAIQLQLLGEHNALNALVAATCAIALSVPISTIKKGLEAMSAVDKRLVRHRLENGTVIIDDSYNANPLAVKAALGVLLHAGKHTTLVLGDMGELGEDATQYHVEIGQYAEQLGIDQIFTLGEFTAHTAKAFGAKGQHFTDRHALVAALTPTLKEDSVVLVKGSKYMQMWHVVHALLEQQGSGVPAKARTAKQG